MDVRCERCRRLHYKCTCKCYICEIDLFDKRQVFKVPDVPVDIVTDHNDNMVCDHCLKCFTCEETRYRDGILRRGRYIFGSRGDLCRVKWFCPKSECTAAISTDPWTISRQKRHEEFMKKKHNEDFSLQGGTNHRPTILGPKVKLLMCPELFDLDSDANIISNMLLCHRFSKMIDYVIFEGGRERGHRGKYSQMTPKFKEYFVASISSTNESRVKRQQESEEKARLRSEKYPDEIPKRIPTKRLIENKISGVETRILLCSEQRCHTGTVQPNDWLSIPKEDIEKCLHFNASLWYYCGRILNDQPIDGFQDRLIAILTRWWELGLYPEGRTGPLDIKNEYIRSQLTRVIKIVDIASNIDKTGRDNNKDNNIDDDDRPFNEESECIICYDSFPGKLIKLEPCGHINYCKECALKISKCSLCSVIITDRVSSNIIHSVIINE